MKRKITGLFLVLAMCLLLLPESVWAEGEEQGSKTVITSVDELLKFAKAVNAGDYDEKTDAVVVLDANLDLSGVEWTPIGQANASGDIEHCFSGKFYGNGHVISNLDFSSSYGKGAVGGFFGYVEKAEISSLTVKGNVNVTADDSEYTFFGTIAGYAENASIFDCVSEVGFQNNGKYIYGFIGMCGYAENTKINYCENKGNITITGDMGSIYAGGILGYATGDTEVSYCVNTGNMILAASHGGGIVGQISGTSKILNCYSTGTLTPLGKGITDVGGIVGTVGNETTVSHCYFAGNIDLSQYTATTVPYSRFGGIGGAVSGTSIFTNNYYTEKENVLACGKNAAAGTAKPFDSMRTEAFYKEIVAGGGNYNYVSEKTPVLPKPKYEVSFAVVPAELTNVVLKVNGEEVSSGLAELEAGIYPVEITADNCNPFSGEITVTADIATHTQTLTLTYKDADYTKADEAIKKANALKKENYKDFSGVEKAVQAVVRGKNITEQEEVDKMTKAIEDAISALEYKDADYTKVDEAVKKANSLKKTDYKDFTGVEKAVKAVVRGKNITEQEEVDKMAKAIEDAIASLEKKQTSSTKTTTDNANKATASNSNKTANKAATNNANKTATSNANKSTTAKNAQTGDNSRIEFWLALFGISGCVGIGAVIVGKRMKHRMK